MDKRTARENARSVIKKACKVVESFDPGADGLARKSQELTLDVLRQTSDPFSRYQFTPGHVTCTALVFHPDRPKVLFMYHHRLHRWLLPGGHVEESDASLAEAAAREAHEETLVRIDQDRVSRLAGIDVHGIPPKKKDPFHLHHDLIWSFRAVTADIATTDEAPSVFWAAEADWARLNVTDSIRNSIRRMRQSPA
jgi:8-oxo-dGTP pyrophosphatase MutT (NUDIX family)